MRKLLAFLILVVSVALPAAAQTTLVTGTVTDSNGIPYAGATLKAQLVTTAGSPVTGTPTVTVTGSLRCIQAGFGSSPCQVPFLGTVGPITLDSGGNIPGGGINLQDDALVTPASTQWLFSVTSQGSPPPLGTGPQSCTAQITITGASQIVTASFSACPALSKSGGGGAALSGNANAIYMSPSCPKPNGANCYFVNDDVKIFTFTGSTIAVTGGSNQITCNNCNFSAADQGKLTAVTSGINNSIAGPTQGGPLFPAATTIATVINSTTVNLSANATGSCTTNCNLRWGTDDTANINAAWGAAIAVPGTCPVAVAPAGNMFFSSAIFNAQPAVKVCSGNANFNDFFGASVIGQGAGVTTFTPTTFWNFSSCTGGSFGVGCMFGGTNFLANFSVDGFFDSYSGQSHAGIHLVDLAGGFGQLINVNLADWDGGDTSLTNTGLYGAFTGQIVHSNIFGFGGTNLTCAPGSNLPLTIIGGYIGNSLSEGIAFSNPPPAPPCITIGVTYEQQGSSRPAVSLVNGGNWVSKGDQWFGPNAGAPHSGVQVGTNGFATIEDALIPETPAGAFNGIAITGGTVHLKNSTIKGGTTGGAINLVSGKFFDDGGNTYTTTNLFSAGQTYIAEGHSVKGICTGVATASSTLGLYNTGSNVTISTCTSATIGLGIPVSGARTLQNLVVTASAAGINASSGVVTVLVDGAATGITCTIGTATSCSDGVHTVAVTDGQRVSIQFTTQAAETLAGVKALVEWN
jgi:hypothetical protein